VARLRHHTFFALAEVNAAISELLPAFNAHPFKKLPGSRHSLFATLDRPALQPLPAQPYEYAEWKRARVNIDYHVEVEGHYYSVPYALVKQPLDVRVSARVVELFHKGTRVASHLRSHLKGRHSTVARTCLRLTGITWNGLRSGCSGGRPTVERPPRGSWKPFSPRAPIPNKASGHVSASCAWGKAMGLSGWKPPVTVP
jgi:hypothetical protein